MNDCNRWVLEFEGGIYDDFCLNANLKICFQHNKYFDPEPNLWVGVVIINDIVVISGRFRLRIETRGNIKVACVAKPKEYRDLLRSFIIENVNGFVDGQELP